LAPLIERQRDAAFYVACLAAALEHARERAVVHRNVVTRNALVDSATGYCALAGFDHACAAAAVRSMVPGAVPAPEAVDGREADCRSDWFGLGCLAFELVHGRGPFADARDLYAAVCDAANGKLPSSVVAEGHFAALVRSLLAHREKRPAKLAALKEQPFLRDFDWAKLRARDPGLPPIKDFFSQRRGFVVEDNDASSSSFSTQRVSANCGFFAGSVVCFTGDNALFDGF